MATVFAGARFRQTVGTPVGQAQRVVQLAVRQQPCTGGDRGAAKLQHQPRVSIELQAPLSDPFVGSAIAAPVGPPSDADSYAKTASNA